MPVARTAGGVSDEAILGYGNVPISIAARYLHTNVNTLAALLKLPYNAIGYAIEDAPGAKHTRYIIPPLRLIKFYTGELMTDSKAKYNTALKQYISDHKEAMEGVSS